MGPRTQCFIQHIDIEGEIVKRPKDQRCGKGWMSLGHPVGKVSFPAAQEFCGSDVSFPVGSMRKTILVLSTGLWSCPDTTETDPTEKHVAVCCRLFYVSICYNRRNFSYTLCVKKRLTILFVQLAYVRGLFLHFKNLYQHFTRLCGYTVREGNNGFYCKFFAEAKNERILKIGQRLAKL